MRPAHDGTPAPPAGRGGAKAAPERSSLIAWISYGHRQRRQQTVGTEPEAEAFPLGQATPDAVPFAVPDRVGSALADHRAASADRLRPCLAGGPLGTPFTVGRKKTALSTSRQAARNRHDHNPDQPTSAKDSCHAFRWVPRNADHTGPSALKPRRQPARC